MTVETGAAFAAISGGFCANFIPTALDTILAGLTESGAMAKAWRPLACPWCS